MASRLKTHVRIGRSSSSSPSTSKPESTAAHARARPQELRVRRGGDCDEQCSRPPARKSDRNLVWCSFFFLGSPGIPVWNDLISRGCKGRARCGEAARALRKALRGAMPQSLERPYAAWRAGARACSRVTGAGECIVLSGLGPIR